MIIKGLNKKKIKKALLSLPIIWGRRTAEDYEILEQTIKAKKEQVDFKITKNGILRKDLLAEKKPGGPTFYTMSISGNSKLKANVIKWFKGFLGDPFDEFTEPKNSEIDFVSWNAEQLDEKLGG